jgi:signal transduction histidine kinase/CheY-like chemotaxis protein
MSPGAHVESGGDQRGGVQADLTRAILFALAYFAGSELGYALSLGPSVGGTFWPPAGISLAVFLVAPVRSWPLLFLAGVGANQLSDLIHGQRLPASIGFAAANLGEPLLGAFLLRRLLPAPVTLTRVHELAALAVVVVFVSAPLAAAVGATVAQFYTPNPPGFAVGWRTWWVGDFVGALVMTPLTLRAVTGWRQLGTIGTRTWLEAVALGLVLWIVTQIVFDAPPTSMAMPFLVFPVLLWASLRLGIVGVGAALCLVVVLTTHDTVDGLGPFAAEHLSQGDRLIALQIYVGVMAVSFYTLGLLWEVARAERHREQLLDAERFARGEAERASQLKDEFLATLSHELRTPLNAIVGWTHILSQTVEDPATRRAVETIARNARVQVKLIDDLLDMSRIMAGKLGLAFSRCSLTDVVTTAAEALKPGAEAKGVTLVVSAVQDLGISCDAARLQQVVTNLLENAIKFTPAGGVVEASVTVGGGMAHLVVRDSGQGISPEFLPAVFDRFRQADGSTTRLHGGLGLGLSIARQIVEMHGGSIRADSEGLGKGSVFTVTLPLTPEGELPQGVASPGVGSALAHLRLLVVDDDEDARELLRRLLVEQGCDVICASSAEEALEALDASACDIMLTDIGMPGTDGYELLQRVRRSRHAELRVIAVTAFARPEDRERTRAAGFDGYVAKPIDPAQLLQTVARLA